MSSAGPLTSWKVSRVSGRGRCIMRSEDGRICRSDMQTILAHDQRELLAGFAHSNVLLAFDYDGTLAPIAPTPDAAQMRRDTRQLLTQVARLYPCIVISGRALDDLTRRFSRIPVWY